MRTQMTPSSSLVSGKRITTVSFARKLIVSPPGSFRIRAPSVVFVCTIARIGVAVMVGVDVGVNVGDGVTVRVWVAVGGTGVGVRVRVGVTVRVGLGVGVGSPM